MKPYSQTDLTVDRRIYNYRHSRARRISENMFGIIANRWRIFRTVINLSPEKICLIARATITLHNFLRKSRSRKIYSPASFVDRDGADSAINPFYDDVLRPMNMPCKNLIPLQRPKNGVNACTHSKRIRDIFKDYFCHEGAVHWQWDRC